jgi:hypothetical protein
MPCIIAAGPDFYMILNAPHAAFPKMNCLSYPVYNYMDYFHIINRQFFVTVKQFLTKLK